jgi:hypothetical protein
VEPSGLVKSSDIFRKDWWIELSTAYAHAKSAFESPAGYYAFRSPQVHIGAVPKGVHWEERPYMLFSRTHHDDNTGHLIFDQYHPLATAIDTHIGIRAAVNVTLVDMVWNHHFFSRYNHIYDRKWKPLIGNIIFNESIRIRDFVLRNKARKQMTCYRHLLVGCGQLSGLAGNVLHRARSLRYIRQRLWEVYAPDTSNTVLLNNVQQRHVVNILMLQKNTTTWKHTNFVLNWMEIVHAVSALPNVSVKNFSPSNVQFPDQVKYYRAADIIISQWGGISMLNFLMPPGGVEILITSWFSDLMSMPNSTASFNVSSSSLICPDFDDRARLSIGDTKSLRFCTRDNGHQPNYVNVTNLMELVHKAVAYRRRINLRSYYRYP